MSPDHREGEVSGVFGLTGILGTCAAHRAAAVFAAQHGIVAGTGSTEFTAWFHQNFDGDARKCEGEEANGQEDFRPTHGAKIRGDFVVTASVVCVYKII